MKGSRSRRLAFTGPPSRLPGEGEMELEPVAGDIQLIRPKLPGSKPVPGPAMPEPDKRELHFPHTPVPVSGVYDLVDEAGTYLKAQATCHGGGAFPPSKNPEALEAQRAARAAWEATPTTDRSEKKPFGYGYRLAYEAIHLQAPPSAGDETIHRPGERVRASGVYNVVDWNGRYLQHQRACVAGEKFPTTEGPDHDAYGYVLEYEAEHLTDR